ncbi:hypothetical protein PR048_018625 [Dryococelus australis]|uniref:Tesmin/TSO1-like CXC domain-containing protein n=1 Tax=Dryococelus australis TaxID=614101 RepID=A0ABQ9HCS7_9NEOP|nr:hypothetical protein PR048_018625 [Dryococelus australis]
MTTEQTLIRFMKTTGGLTQGQGISDSAMAKWILTMPILVEVTQKIEEFCNLSFASTEQHVAARDTRISRDEADVQKLVDWFPSHHPFPNFTTHKEPAPPALLSTISRKCKKGCTLACSCRKAGINCSTICYHCKGQACTISLVDDITTNSANQEAEINIKMEEVISEEVDLLEVECEPVQVEKSDSEKTDIDDFDTSSTSKKITLL